MIQSKVLVSTCNVGRQMFVVKAIGVSRGIGATVYNAVELSVFQNEIGSIRFYTIGVLTLIYSSFVQTHLRLNGFCGLGKATHSVPACGWCATRILRKLWIGWVK